MLDAFTIGTRVAARIGARRRGRPSPLPPGPEEPGIWQVISWIRWPIPYMREMRRRYGRTFTMRIPGVDPLVIFSEPEVVKEIFTGPSDALHAGEANSVLEPLVGAHSLLLLDGDKHMRHRKLLLPPFHGERMHAYGEAMRDVTLESMRSWPRGRPFPIHPRTQSITLDVILRTVFGMDEGARMDSMRRALAQLLDYASQPYLLVPQFQIDFGPWSPYAKLVRLLENVDREVYAQIADRRARGTAGQTDVLSLMLDARDEEGGAMSDVELRDELVTLLIAGHETTATSLAWTFLHLVRDRDALRRVHAELDEAFPDGRVDPGKKDALPYVDAVVREALRLQPVIPMVGRRLQRPMRIGGWDLPAGVIVAPSIWLSHMNPDNWPEPERFRPERFLDHKASPYSFLPFGGGIRRCIGMAFALYEMRIVLATVLRELTVRAAPGYEPTLVRRGIAFAPSEGMPLVCETR